MVKVIIRDKETSAYIGQIDIYRDEIKNLEQDFIVVVK